MSLKKTLALLLSLCMLLGVVGLPQTALAFEVSPSNDETKISANKANISWVYLGKTTSTSKTQMATLDYTAKTLTQDPIDLTSTGTTFSNQTFWIGVQLENMSKVWDLMNPSKNGTNLNDGKSRTGLNDGLFAFTFGITYNTKYLKYYPGTTSAADIFANTVQKNYDKYYDEDGEPIEIYGNSSFVTSDSADQSYCEPLVLPTDDGDLATVYQSVKVSLSADVQSDLGDELKRMFQADTAEGISDDKVVVAAIPFRFVDANVDKEKLKTDGQQVLQGRFSFAGFTVSTGSTGSSANNDMAYQWYYDRNNDQRTNLKNYFNITNADGTAVSDGVVDLFPGTAAEPKLTKIQKNSGSSIAPQYVNNGFSDAGLKIDLVYNKAEANKTIDKTSTEWADVTFKTGAAGITDPTDAGLAALPAKWSSGTTTHLYAIYKDKIADMGEFTTQTATLSKIENNSSKIATQYQGAAFSNAGIKIKATYSDGSTKDIDATNNSDLFANVTYKYANTNNVTTESGLTAMPNPLTALSNKYLYAVLDGKIACLGAFSTTVPTTTKLENNGSVIATQYQGTAFNKTGLSVKATDAISQVTIISESDTDKTNWSQVTLKYGPAGITTTTDSKLVNMPASLPALSNQTLYAIYGGCIASLGTFSTQTDAITGLAITTNTVTGVSEGHKILDKLTDTNFVVTITRASGKTETAKKSELSGKGITIQLEGSGGTYSAVSANTTFGSGANKIRVSAGSVNSDPVTITAGANALNGITVTKKPSAKATYGDAVDMSSVRIKRSYSNGTSDATEVAVPSDLKIFKVTGSGASATYTEVKTGDVYDIGANRYVVATADRSVIGTPEIDVEGEPKELTVNATAGTISKTYDGTTALDADDSVAYAVDASGLVGSDTAVAVKGLTFTYASAHATSTPTAISYSGTPTTDNTAFNNKYKLKLGTMFAGDKVTNVTGTITPKEITVTDFGSAPTAEIDTAATASIEKTRGLTLNSSNSTGLVGSDEVTVTITYTYTADDLKVAGNKTGLAASAVISGGTAMNNYTLKQPATGTATGNVNDLAVSSISADDLEVTYPSSVSEMVSEHIIIATLEDGSTIEVDSSDCELTVGGAAFDPSTVGYGESVEITVTYKEKTAKFNLVTKKKAINVSTDLTIENAVAALGGELEEGSVVGVAEGVAEGSDNITITSDNALASSAVIGRHQPVDAANLALDDESAKYYVLVDDTGAETDSATINGATVKPATPDASVDTATNKIKIAVDEDDENVYVYSVDGGATWYDVDEDGILQELELTIGDVYTVISKLEDDTEDLVSDESDELSPYKYFVQLLAASNNNVYASAYTNEQTIANSSELLALLGKSAPSNVDKYYYLDGDEQKDIAGYEIADDWTVYYTVKQSTGGGGGGFVSMSYAVTYEAGENGTISGNNTETVSRYKSPQAVPSVTANEGYEFIGWSLNGKDVVNPETVQITSRTTFTALYKEAKVQPVIEHNYLEPYATGYKDGTFGPDKNITRAELAAMIARLSNKGDITTDYSSSFKDVTSEKWYSKYIGYLEKLDVLSGYPDGTFAPDATISRSEMCAIIARTQKLELTALDDIFMDIDSDHWGRPYIAAMLNNELVTGYPNGTFAPDAPLTRAEAVTIINRVLGSATANVVKRPSDIAGHWAEKDIILAVNQRELIEEDDNAEEL